MIDVYVTVHWHTYIQLCLQLAMNRRLLWLKLWNMIVCIFLFEYRTLFRVLGSIVERSPTIWLWCSFMISPQVIGACFLLKEWGKMISWKSIEKEWSVDLLMFSGQARDSSPPIPIHATSDKSWCRGGWTTLQTFRSSSYNQARPMWTIRVQLSSYSMSVSHGVTL